MTHDEAGFFITAAGLSESEAHGIRRAANEALLHRLGDFIDRRLFAGDSPAEVLGRVRDDWGRPARRP